VNRAKPLYTVFWFVILLVQNTQTLKAQQQPQLLRDSSFVKVLTAAIDSMYNASIDASYELLQPYKKRYPNHPLWNFWDGLHLWWQILPNLSDTERDAEFYYHFKKCDYEATRILQRQKQHVDALVLKILSNGFLARQYANRDEWIKSLNFARVGIESLLELKKISPEMVDIQFGDGLYDYYTAYLPTEYTWLKKLDWMLPEGDRDGGLNQLKQVAQNGLFLKYESIYFLGNIYENYEHNTDLGVYYFEELARRFPNNPFYAKRLVQIYHANYPSTKAIKLSKALLKNSNYLNAYSKPYFDEAACYQIGKTYLSLSQADSAQTYLQKGLLISEKLKNHKKRYYYNANVYYMAQSFFQKNEPEKAKEWLLKVSDTYPIWYDRAQSQLKEMR
jgi:hypothetical protein